MTVDTHKQYSEGRITGAICMTHNHYLHLPIKITGNGGRTLAASYLPVKKLGCQGWEQVAGQASFIAQ